MKLLMFPGQGSQYSGMAKDWFDNFSEAKLAFEEASDFADLKLKKLIFDGTDYDLKATEITQPAILAATVAIFRCLKNFFEFKVEDHLFAGHSLGEYSALVCAGALELGPAARLVRHRGQYMQHAVPAGEGGMTALIFKPGIDGAPLARSLCEDVSRQTKMLVSVANYNSPEQIVIAGQSDALALCNEQALHQPYGARKAVPLPVSAPFHCALMKPAAEKLSPELKEVAWKPARTRYIANIDAQVHSMDQGIAKRLEAQITGSVRWVESVQAAISNGAHEAIEIGPGKVLAGLAKRISLDGTVLAALNIDRFEEFKNANVSF